MATWGFWDWLTYVCIGVAALMTAFDQAVKNAPVFRRRIGRFLKLPIWSFTPFVLIMASALIIFTRHILPGGGPPLDRVAQPATQIPATSQTSQTLKPLEIPAALASLSNDDIRALAYLVSAHVGTFLEDMSERQSKIWALQSWSIDNARHVLMLE